MSGTWIGVRCSTALPIARLAEVDVTIPDRGDDLIIHSVGRAQSEFPAGFVEYIDGARLGVGELCRLGDDGSKDGLEIEASSLPRG